MENAIIAKKLSNLYCSKANLHSSNLDFEMYGVTCNESIKTETPKDINLKIDILEFYGKMEQTTLSYYINNNNCLKKLING